MTTPLKILTRKRIKRIALGLIIAVMIWCVIVALSIWRYGSHDDALKSDCIIVLGAAVEGENPSPVFAERIRHGIHLYDSGYASKLIFTGGCGEGHKYSESGVGSIIATQREVSANDIYIEEKSRTTQQNIAEAAALMKVHNLKSAIIVSDPLHMKRAMMMADDLGIEAVSSPTPTTRYRSLRTKLGFLLRELYFVHHYVLTGN
ncbi:MAG: YdcF family protein [Akkermansiaceae bacterium]|nr:YdcF family protein [Luteolibacter sp.]